MRSRVAVLAAVAIVLLVHARPASAQCQASEAGEIQCIYRFWEPDHWGPDSQAHPNLNSDPGTQIAITLVQIHDQGIAIPAAIIAGSPVVAPSVAIGNIQIGNIQGVVQSFDQRVDFVQNQAVGDQLQTTIAGASIPQVQGTVPTDHADGTTASGNNVLLDPVDPVTGEYIIRYVDLELPSFGVPLRIQRVYRSRIDYNGPFGPSWDHSYNQRLFNVPDVPIEGPPDTTAAYSRLPVANITVPKLSSLDSSTCGPQLDLTTGAGTTIRFREYSRSGSTIYYSSSAEHLTLTGTDAPNGPTWALRSSHGDVRSFDVEGHLVSWVDANGVGLSITWSGTGALAQLATITDSVGRVVTFDYDALGRIEAISEPSSGLVATYKYADNGALERAYTADGRLERYEYDVDPSRGRGDWVPEAQLRAGCEAACAHSDSTCETGGACDAPVAEAMDLCTRYITDDCPGDCARGCMGACQDACLQDGEYCDSYCEATNIEAEKDACRDVYDDEVSDACNSCVDVCEADADAVCHDAWERGDILDTQISDCIDNFTSCCGYGLDCGPNACNAAYGFPGIPGIPQCQTNCHDAFLGFQPVDTECEQPDVPSGCLAAAIDRCKVGGYDEAGNAFDGCADVCASAECAPACEAQCLPTCNISQCLAQDFEGQCEESCTETCIEGGRAPGSPTIPHYGHPGDLNFNIVKVFNGAGELYLQNTYGTDPASPDFDTVIQQQYGEYQPKLARADLVNGPSGLPAWAAPLVETQAAFVPVDICPYTCEAPPPDYNDIAVPIDGMVLVFQPIAVTSPVTGLATTKVLAQRVWPTLVTFTLNAQGVLVGKINRRTSTTNYLATTATSIPLTLNDGASVTLATSNNGNVTVTGTTAGKDQLLAMGTMTLFTDATKHVEAYPGVPIEALQFSSGSCSQPFTVERVSDTEIKLQPSTACQGDLWLTPLGGVYPNQSEATNFPRDGLAALTNSAFHPVALSPTRGGFVWRNGIEGRRVREAPPTGVGQADAGRAALTQYGKAPMFSAPNTASATEPLFAFHWVTASYGVGPPLPAPSDQPWQNLDPAIGNFEFECDPTMPSFAIHGGGARPKQATAIIDFHGARWTYYADDHNRVLRTINHETNAVWSFNYDPIGQLVGIEAPDLSRTCLVYDEHGNVKRRLEMPAVLSGLPTPDPIRVDMTYDDATSQLTSMTDPRTGTTFRQIARDAKGNPTSVIEADGATTSIYPAADLGGAYEAGRVVRPGGAETRFEYDKGTGTLASITTDATGALPLTESFDHDDAGRTVAIENPLGMLSTNTFDGAQLAFAGWKDDDHSARQTMTYDEAGRVKTVATGIPGAERATEKFEYSVTGAPMSAELTALDGSASKITTCQDIAPGDRLMESVSGEGIRYRYAYDGDGNVTSINAGDLGPSTRTWDDGCLDHPSGGAQQFTLASFTYDSNGRVVGSTDARGRGTSIARDGFGRAVMEERSDGTQLRRGFDALGNVVWEALYTAVSAPPYRAPSWSDVGLLAASEMVYDSRGRLTDVNRWHFDDAHVAVDDGYSTTTFVYDDVAHTITRRDDAKNEWVTRYDGAGRVVEERAPDGTARTYTYLADRRTVRISEPSPAGTVTQELALTSWGDVASEGARVGTTTYPLSSTQFDDMLRPVSIATLSGGTTSLSYDAFGRTTGLVQSVPDGNGETIAISYDRDGNPTTRSSTAGGGAASSTWNWRYDALGRLIDAQDPSTRHTTTSYILGSQYPAVVTDPRGVQLQHSWATNVNQLFLNAVDPNGPDVSLSYLWDGRGNLVSSSRADEGSPAVTNIFGYDSLGDRTSETDNQLPTTWTRSTTFDGRMLPLKSSVNNTNWTRHYDLLGRLDLIRVGTESNPLAAYTYAGFGFRLSRTLQNGITTNYGYDALGRLISQADVKSGASLPTWAWQIPLDGVPRRADFRRGTTAGEDNSVFTIDAGLRLVDEDLPPAASFTLTPTTSWAAANTTAATTLDANNWHYTLDGRSAWSRRVRGTTGATDYLRDARDAVTQIGTQNVTLDARGAITNDGSMQATYDALGQVKQITSGTKVRTYARDALGRIVSETNEAGQVTRYGWDGAVRLVRQRPGGSIYDVTIDGAGLDEHVATLNGGNRQFLHQDRLGSVYMVSNSSGAPAEFTSYTAYGEATLRNNAGTPITASTVNAQFGFNGLPQDFAMGVVDMRARMYRPVLGRFLSPDPAGLVDGTNRFAFVGASPLSLRDPTGLCSQDPGLMCIDQDNPDPTDVETNRQILNDRWDGEWHDHIAGQDAAKAAAEQRRVDDIHAAGRYFRRVYHVTTTSLAVAAVGLSCATAPLACVKGVGKSFVFASLTSSGGFEGMGMITGVLGGALSFSRGAVAAELESSEAIGADLTRGPASGDKIVTPPGPDQIIRGSLERPVFEGHGLTTSGQFTMPSGTYLQLPDQIVLSEAEGQAAAMQGSLPQGSYSLLQPGDTVGNLVLFPKTEEMVVRMTSWQVTRPTLLSDILEEDMGLCVWAACRRPGVP